MDIKLALMAGTDIPIPECQLTLHQPTIKEIAYLGDEDFFKGVQTLCVNKNMLSQDKVALSEINNFQIFMMVMNDKTTDDKKIATRQLLSVLFPQYNILMSPRAVMLSPREGGEGRVIDDTNFEALQEILKEVFCVNSGKQENQNFNPVNEQARKIAEKIMKGRQKVAELKEKHKTSIFAQYLSVLTVGLHSMSLFDLLNTTMYQLYDLLERYSLYTNWDIDIRSRMAGAKNDKPLDNWMRDIHDKSNVIL